MKKKIKNYEEYEVDDLGNIYRNNKILKPQLNESGYYRVCLSKKGKLSKKYIHRLVAEAFIPNLKNKKQVNHIDGNKLNNNVDNLEWATPSENIRHAFKNKLSYIPKGKQNHLYGRYDINANNHIAILQYDLENNFIKKWNSIAEASRQLNINYWGIEHCCKKITRKSGGYIWKYEKKN